MIKQVLLGVLLLCLVPTLLGALGLMFRAAGLVIPPEWAWSCLVAYYSLGFVAIAALHWYERMPYGSPTWAGWVAVISFAASWGSILVVALNSPESNKAVTSVLNEFEIWLMLSVTQRPWRLVVIISAWSLAGGLYDLLLALLRRRYDARMKEARESGEVLV